MARPKWQHALFVLVTLAGCSTTPDALKVNGPQPAQQVAVRSVTAPLRVQNVNWTNRTIVVTVRDQLTGNLIPPTINGVATRVQSTDSFQSTYDSASTAYVISLDDSVQVGSNREVQVKANGYISANGKISLSNTQPTYLLVRVVPTGTKAGGTQSNFTVENIASLSVAPTDALVLPNNSIILTVTGTTDNGTIIDNPLVNFAITPDDGSGQLIVNSAGQYEFDAGPLAAIYRVTFSLDTISAQAIIRMPTEVTVAPQSLEFLEVGQTLTFAAAQIGFEDAFTAPATCDSSDNYTVASVAADANPGNFRVTAVAAGSCQITVTGQFGKTATVQVSVIDRQIHVDLPGTSSNLSFGAIGPGKTQTFSVSQAGYTGNFTTSAACTAADGTTVATVSPTSSPRDFTMTPVTPGICTITIAGDANTTVTIPVVVTATTLLLD